MSFEGDTTAVVPVERISRGTVRDSSNGMVDGDECFVTWSNKKRYAVVFITAGMLAVKFLLTCYQEFIIEKNTIINSCCY